MNKEEKLESEKIRQEEMKKRESRLRSEGYKGIAGVDEVGRGPLAGPVVAAAVILPEDFNVLGVNDSKQLSEKKREELFDRIIENAEAYGIGMADNRVIDEINILQATKQAMRDAIADLQGKRQVDYILFDAMEIEDIDVPQESVIKGDAKVLAIAAASIVAKVTRDRIMVRYSEEYPGYAFEKNKGYGTKAHYEGIEKKGICPIHRRSFLKKILED